MMQLLKTPIVIMKLGGKTINPLNIFGLHLVSDINSILPTLVFSLRDSQGQLLSSLDGLVIGTKVEITVMDDFLEEGDEVILKTTETTELATLRNTLGGGASSTGRSVAFTTFYVASITDVVPERTDTLAGEIQVSCVHKWAIHRNYENRLYGNMLTNGDIIKDLLLKAKCNFATLPPANLYISDTDKNGSTPRYKCCIDDITFLRDYILPYTTVGSLPSFFFVTDTNQPRLQNFKQMFNTLIGSKVLFTAGGNNRNLEFRATIESKASSTFSGLKLNMYSAAIRIGDKDPIKVLENLKTQIVCDMNSASGGCDTGEMIPKYVLTETSEKRVDPLPTGNTLPIDTIFMKYSSGPTGVRTCRNKSFDDQAALLKNSQRKMYELFSMEILTDFCGSYVSVGDVVTVLTDPIKTPESDNFSVVAEPLDKVHWADGKWVVKRIEHEYEDEQNELGESNLISRLTLIRPSFYYYESTVSLSDTTKAALEEVYM